VSAIKTIQEIVRAALDECVESLSAKFLPAVRPIYGSTAHGRPEHIGTCTLLRLGEDRYLVTAAHVIDHNTDNATTLYLGGAPGQDLIEINADFWATVKPDNHRENDHHDFALWKMPPDVINALGDVKYFEDSEIGDGRTSPDGRNYLALGYPNSKNKKLDNPNKRVVPKLWKYSASAKPNDQLASRLGIFGHDHFFLDFDSEHSRDPGGEIVNSINPRGASGGPLIDMGRIANPENLAPDRQLRGRLAGILIEHQDRDKAIVAVKIGLVLGRVGHRPESRYSESDRRKRSGRIAETRNGDGL